MQAVWPYSCSLGCLVHVLVVQFSFVQAVQLFYAVEGQCPVYVVQFSCLCSSGSHVFAELQKQCKVVF